MANRMFDPHRISHSDLRSRKTARIIQRKLINPPNPLLTRNDAIRVAELAIRNGWVSPPNALVLGSLVVTVPYPFSINSTNIFSLFALPPSARGYCLSVQSFTVSEPSFLRLVFGTSSSPSFLLDEIGSDFPDNVPAYYSFSPATSVNSRQCFLSFGHVNPGDVVSAPYTPDPSALNFGFFENTPG